ncbi:MAG: alanine:cation symporter family protein [Muribaculaceae bacterium]|nr:alanine:cation symporter family protein [Muribaculaceae bacterium]
MNDLKQIVDSIANVCSDSILVPLLLIVAVYFTIITRGVQFTMMREMLRLLVTSGKREGEKPSVEHRGVSSFQAFAISIASRVGTGNLAGVASAIAIGGPGAVFWMWIIALLGAASAFVESTLAQLYKIKGEKSFRGGPAYYILHGLHCRPWAIVFAVLITLTFGFAFNSVQANTIADAMNESFGIPPMVVAIALTVLTMRIVCGGITRISQFSQWVVPVMAIAYILLALIVVIINISEIPRVFSLIVENAFGFNQALGGTLGAAMVMGIKRGLFSNEAGEGSTPNAAATADVSHPVKQGLIQALGVYTDTLVICSCTAFIILCSGLYLEGHDGIVLTQRAIDAGLGTDTHLGSLFVSIAIFFFAFTSIVANYYYGETNIQFITRNKSVITVYRLLVGAIVFVGALASLDLVWGFADITMALMTLCNLGAIVALSPYVRVLLEDYRRQRRLGDPIYRRSTLPKIASDTPCWPD